MFHPNEFWQAILTQPHDDTPRLVYADWLEERGEPLAEFIRLQCQLAERTSVAEFRIGSREHHLLSEHSREWAGAICDDVEWWSFHRGFIEEVSLTTEQLARRADDLFRHAPLEDLHLTPRGADLHELPAVSDLQ